MQFFTAITTAQPHRRRRPVLRVAGPVVFVVMSAFSVPALARSWQVPQEHAAPQAGEHAAEGHGESPGAFISRLANFAILVGGLWYVLRSPIGRYIHDRARQIREGLVTAARLKSEAAGQLATIEKKMRALPGELEKLKERGAHQIETERAHIQRAAEAERERLVERMRRDIDLRVQSAQRDLREYGARLAVEAAERRVESQINDDDQRRLIGQYIAQVQAAHE
jgi:F-type H+-transporting ATPase subunit b